MTDRNIPYTADDLRYTADQIDIIMAALGTDDLEDGDWRWGLSVDVFDDDNKVTGQIRPNGDGWLGYYPNTKEII